MVEDLRQIMVMAEYQRHAAEIVQDPTLQLQNTARGQAGGGGHLVSRGLDGGGLERGQGGTEATKPVQECVETPPVDCRYV